MEPSLPVSFYAREAEVVARDLLGKVLVRELDGRPLHVRIVETEAYLGPHDLACHASKGRTARTEVMFGPPGHAYVYLIYGMYDMLNVVTGRNGSAQAVLIRAAEPLATLDAGTNGPGRLTRALAVDRSLNGHLLADRPLYLTAGRPPAQVVATSRVGIEYSGPWRDARLRFFDGASRFVSKR